MLSGKVYVQIKNKFYICYCDVIYLPENMIILNGVQLAERLYILNFVKRSSLCKPR
jgi:hypothetical protein